jgi:hypothetical protein
MASFRVQVSNDINSGASGKICNPSGMGGGWYLPNLGLNAVWATLPEYCMNSDSGSAGFEISLSAGEVIVFPPDLS